MKFMVIVKANADSEAGKMPSTALVAAMGKYNEDLVKEGVLLDAAGLFPSSNGARVRFNGAKRTVIDGPFVETTELIAGYWIFQCKSREEAIERVKRAPNPSEGESVIEIRQIFDADDFGEILTPELREQERKIGEQMAANAKR
ncbi:MAG TPA: YciI family protein [Gemmatimonadaceae bacterium]|nr:YciI family protein [Gemmatimonadaceae bacterium]